MWQPSRPGQWVKFMPADAVQQAALAATSCWRAPDGMFVGIYQSAGVLQHHDPRMQPTAFPPRIEPVDATQGHIFQVHPDGESRFLFYGMSQIGRMEPLLNPEELPPASKLRPGAVLRP
jgi:hypothetical protein